MYGRFFFTWHQFIWEYVQITSVSSETAKKVRKTRVFARFGASTPYKGDSACQGSHRAAARSKSRLARARTDVPLVACRGLCLGRARLRRARRSCGVVCGPEFCRRVQQTSTARPRWAWVRGPRTSADQRTDTTVVGSEAPRPPCPGSAAGGRRPTRSAATDCGVHLSCCLLDGPGETTQDPGWVRVC